MAIYFKQCIIVIYYYLKAMLDLQITRIYSVICELSINIYYLRIALFCSLFLYRMLLGCLNRRIFVAGLTKHGIYILHSCMFFSSIYFLYSNCSLRYTCTYD